MIIACVLRSGGHYDVDYLEHLGPALSAWAPGNTQIVCLTDKKRIPDVFQRVPLRESWPGWWAKFELMAPDFAPNQVVHYLDLDTLVLGPIKKFLLIQKLSALEDFYRPRRGFGSGAMVLPPSARRRAWDYWTVNPRSMMKRAGPFGDQMILGEAWGRIPTLQSCLPSHYIASSKARHHPIIAKRTRIVCFHGQPRPRDIDWRVP